MAECQAVCVDPAQVRAFWPLVSDWLRRSMQRGDLGTFAALETDVFSADALLWLAWNGAAIEGAAVTQVALVESGKVCIIAACGGESAKRWLWLLPRIEQYARAERCRAVRIMGRKGWSRVLPEYRACRVVMDKEL